MENKKHLLPEGVSVHGAGLPEFVGQQSGAAADLLHAEFRVALAALPQVQRAYLCKLRYPGAERIGAAVCVACDRGEDMQVVEALAAVIQTNVGPGSHINILFVSPSLEEGLASVCQPFYMEASRRGAE